MNNWKPSAIIFDMDGLLVDSEPVWERAEHALMAARGREYTPAIREKLIGLRVDEFLEGLRAIYNLPETVEELYAELLERLMPLLPGAQVKPGAAEMIRYAAERGLPAAIASSSPAAVIEAVVETHGWSAALPVRVSAEIVARGKPAPDVYLKTAELLGVTPVECLALEDSPNGSRAAVAAGMRCYAVPDRSHSLPSAFDGITPYVFDSLYAVLESLG